MRKPAGKILILLLIAVLTGCKLEDKSLDGKLNIVCTTTICGDAIRNIVGDSARVTVLMGPGVDPHEYVPRQGDMDKLSNADVLVYHGLHLEGKMTDVIEALEKKNVHTINLGDAVSDDELIYGDGEGHEHNGHYHQGGLDPHVWNNIDIWKKCVAFAGNELAKIQPENKAAFSSNTEHYVQRLSLLKLELDSMYDLIPENQRVLVTAHDAFGYLARAHNLKTRSLQGVSTAAEFGIKDVTNLADYLVENNIRSIFLETSVPNKNLEAVISNCRAKGYSVSIGGVLYSDALGDKESGTDTYIDMMRANAKTIVDGLK